VNKRHHKLFVAHVISDGRSLADWTYIFHRQPFLDAANMIVMAASFQCPDIIHILVFFLLIANRFITGT